MIRRFLTAVRGLFWPRAAAMDGEPTEAGLLAQATRCTGCGACDAAMPGYARLPRPSFRGPSDLALTIGRSPDDVEAVRDLLERLDERALATAQAACPEAVPLVALAASLRGKARAQPPRDAPRALRKPHDPG